MYSVVLVEDETHLRRELAQTTPWRDMRLELVGEAADGLAGEEIVVSLQPDIVLTDIRLPGQDGLTMLEHTLPPHAVIFSGHSDARLMQQAIRIGVDDYLFKPVDDDELSRALAKVVRTLDAETAIPAAGARTDPGGPGPVITPLPRLFGRHRVDEAIRFMESAYQNAIGLQETADALGLSPHYLSRLFHKTTGYPFLSYLTRFRVLRAMELMRDPRLNITEVYTACGFRTGSHFARVFRRYTGESPGSWRNRMG